MTKSLVVTVRRILTIIQSESFRHRQDFSNGVNIVLGEWRECMDDSENSARARWAAFVLTLSALSLVKSHGLCDKESHSRFPPVMIKLPDK